MADIHEFTTVGCPFTEAPAYLQAFFIEHGASGGAGATLDLSVPVGDVKIQREVTASMTPLPAFSGYDRFAIGWEPKGGGPFPSFEGKLTLSEESIGFTRLDLDGTYTPPGGPLGAAFDAVAGAHIAAHTAQSLLERLKSAIERAHAHAHDLPIPRPAPTVSVEDA